MTTICLEEYSLGPVEAIPPGEGRTYRVAEREVAIFRSRSGEVHATQARCPHRGAPLADGVVGGGKVLCPFHAYAFDLATGEALNSGCPQLEIYPVAVSARGEIVLGLPQVRPTRLLLADDPARTASGIGPTTLATPPSGGAADDVRDEPLG